jgi:hypothetical protein
MLAEAVAILGSKNKSRDIGTGNPGGAEWPSGQGDVVLLLEAIHLPVRILALHFPAPNKIHKHPERPSCIRTPKAD